MKKQLFNKWYENYGRNLAKEICPYNIEEINETVEKELRKNAKKIFSSVYDLYSQRINESLCGLKDEFLEALNEMNLDYQHGNEIREKIENELEEYKALSTELYDLHREEKIKEDYFIKLKELFGERIYKLKENRNNLEKITKAIKKDKKNVELLVR